MTTVSERTVQGFTHNEIPIPDELRILGDFQDPDPTDCVFRVLSQKDGDKRVVWNRNSIPEINAAKQMFASLIAEGMVPYRVGAGGLAADVMDEFDPSAQEVIFMPTKMIAGG